MPIASVVVPVEAGCRVDFACTPGGGVNAEYDASGYVFRIEHVRRVADFITGRPVSAAAPIALYPGQVLVWHTPK